MHNIQLVRLYQGEIQRHEEIRYAGLIGKMFRGIDAIHDAGQGHRPYVHRADFDPLIIPEHGVPLSTTVGDSQVDLAVKSLQSLGESLKSSPYDSLQVSIDASFWDNSYYYPSFASWSPEKKLDVERLKFLFGLFGRANNILISYDDATLQEFMALPRDINTPSYHPGSRKSQ